MAHHQLNEQEKNYADTMATCTGYKCSTAAVEAAIAVIRHGADAQVEADSRRIELAEVQRAQGMIRMLAIADQFSTAPHRSGRLNATQIVSRM
jgi:hypothetical protein